MLVLIASVACFTSFVFLERRVGTPLIPRALLRRRPFVVACAAAAIFMGSFGAEFYVVTLLMNETYHYSAVMAGLAFLPLAAAAPLGSAVTGLLSRATGTTRTLLLGFAVGSLGILLLLPMAGAGAYATTVLPGLVVSGFGQGVTYTATFRLGTSVLDQQRGTGAAFIATVQYFGGSLGLAALVAVMGGANTGIRAREGILTLATVAMAGVVLGVPLRAGRDRLGDAK